MTRPWRTVRVYICSTFRDMHAERDHLVKVVFPALRERLEKYRFHLIDIDLRWGVTQEQVDNDQALDMVLQQIDECRPFFISMLGERYGYIPTRFAEGTVARHPWLAEYVGRSINEIDILHGALLHPDERTRAVFYFRDPAALSVIPYPMRAGYIETDSEAVAKLADLKNRIRASTYPVMENYPARWDPEAYDPPTRSLGRLVGVEAFGQHVNQQLWEAIKSEFNLTDTPSMAPDHLTDEQDYHERFMESRLEVFIGRERLEAALMQFAEGSEPHACLVTGPAGSGKSTLLARFVSSCRSRFPFLVIPHFVGASPDSTSATKMLRRYCLIIQQRLDIAQDVPRDFSRVVKCFRECLGKIAAESRTILVIDGIDRLTVSSSARALNWLPWALPPHVKVIVSCANDTDNPVLGTFHERPHRTLVVESASDAECAQAIRQFPSLYAKALDSSQVDMLLANPATRNPLFLRVMLEELRGFGSFEQLTARIAAFPREGDVLTALFTQVLERLEHEYNASMVHVVLSCLACSRRGLSERELADLIVTPQFQSEDTSDSLFSVLRQLRPYLHRRGDLIDFFHRGLYNAVRQAYLASPDKRQAGHRRLCEYFGSLPNDNSRRLDELPWQLLQGQDWHRAMELVVDLGFMEARFQQGAIAEFYEDCESILHYAPAETEVQRRLLGEFLAFAGAYASILRDEELAADEPDLVATLAFNRTDSGPVVSQAAKILEDHHGTMPHMVTRRPRYSVDNPLKLMLHRAGTTVVGLQIHPRGDAAYCGLSNGKIRRWDLKTGEDAEIASAAGALGCIRLTNSGHKMCLLSGESVVDVCSTDTGDQLRSVTFPDKVVDLVVLPDDTGCLVALANGGLCRLQIEGYTDLLVPNEFASLGPMTSIAVSPSGQFVLCGHQNGGLSLWDMHAKALRGRFHGHNGGVTSVAFHPAGNSALSGGNDWAIHTWDYLAGRQTGVLLGHSSRISALAITADARFAVSAGGWDQTILIWDLQLGRCLTSLRSSTFHVTSIAISHDGRCIVSGGDNGILELWDIQLALKAGLPHVLQEPAI